MSDYKALTLSECVDALIKADDPLVFMHVRPDGDTVGSAMALCEILRAMGKGTQYACADKIPDRLLFLTEGMCEAEALNGRTAIAVDVASPAQLGELYDKADVALTIDHHAVNTPFSPHYTIPGASSAGEVLYGIAKELEARGLIKIDAEIAKRLYAAISSDTGGFVFSNSTASTYKCAAELIEYGFDHADINQKLFFSKSPGQIAAEGIVASRIATAASGRIAYATVSQADIKSAGLAFSDFETGIDIVRSLHGAEVALIVKESERGFKASMRSVGKDVAKIAARHGGGGHIRAAGCTVEAKDVNDAAKILVAELEELF